MPSLEEIQEQLLDKEALLAELELENITPVIIGGYNARPYSSVLGLVEEPRPTEIKGMWRWWARALVSGALIEDKKIDVGSIAKADEIIAHVLGGRIGEELKPSKVLLKIRLLEKNVEELSGYKNSIVRLKLLAQGIKPEESEKFKERFTAYKGLKLKIKIYKYLSPGTSVPTSFYEFAIASLLLSLVFSGLGAITTRAFGSVKVKIKCLNKELDQNLRILKSIVEEIYTVTNAKEVENKVKELIDLALQFAMVYIHDLEDFEEKIKGIKLNDLPSIPSVVKSEERIFRLKILYSNIDDIYKILRIIGESVLKQRMKRYFGFKRQASNKDINTFILGLPRSGKFVCRNEELKTGYLAPEKEYKPRVYNKDEINKAKKVKVVDKRRISTIGFTVLRRKPTLILVYGMLAKDIDMIKQEIFHRGVYPKYKEVYDKKKRKMKKKCIEIVKVKDTPLDRINVVQEFNKLWNCIISIIKHYKVAKHGRK